MKSNLSLFINFSNHPVSSWDEAQTAAALALGEELVDMPFPTIDPEWDEARISDLVEEYVHRIVDAGRGYASVTVHLMGEFTFCYALVHRLSAVGIRCVASCTRREVHSTDQGLVHAFHFVQFRAYRS